MDDGKYIVLIEDNTAYVYDSFGVELVGSDFKTFTQYLASCTVEKKLADYEKNIIKVMSNCQWTSMPTVKGLVNNVPSVYVIGSPSKGMIKVGRSESVRKRIGHHAKYSGRDIQVLGVWQCPDEWHMIWLESAIHYILSDYMIPLEKEREWFYWEPTVEEFRSIFSIKLGGIN